MLSTSAQNYRFVLAQQSRLGFSVVLFMRSALQLLSQRQMSQRLAFELEFSCLVRSWLTEPKQAVCQSGQVCLEFETETCVGFANLFERALDALFHLRQPDTSGIDKSQLRFRNEVHAADSASLSQPRRVNWKEGAEKPREVCSNGSISVKYENLEHRLRYGCFLQAAKWNCSRIPELRPVSSLRACLQTIK
jgi:hypothetical protein